MLPVALGGLSRPLVDRRLVHARGAAVLDERRAVHDDRVDVAPRARVHERLDGIRVGRDPHVVEVDEHDVGLAPGREPSEVGPLDEPARAQGRRIVDVAALSRLVVPVRDAGQDRRPAQLRHHVHRERVGAHGDLDAAVEVPLERVERHRHLRVLVRAMPHRGARLGEDADVVAERIERPRMRRREDAVADQRAMVEESDVRQELDGRLPVLVHDALELDHVAAGMRVDGHAEVPRRRLARAQQRLAAGLHLRRVEHAAEAPLGRPVIRLDECHRLVELLGSCGSVRVVVQASPLVREGIAVAKWRARVDAHAQIVDELRVALPISAQAAHVDDRGGAVLERVQEDEGAQGRDGVRRRRGELALERRGEGEVVGRAVVVLDHVAEHPVAAIAGRVHVGIDEARRHELAPGGHPGVDRRPSRDHPRG